jgi:protein-disulfide isomerase
MSAFVLLLLASCSGAAQTRKKPGPGDVVATVGGVSVTLEQVDEKALRESASNFGNLRLSLAVYEARKAAVDEIVGTILLDQEAKRRGIERSVLYEQEISAHVSAVTDADVAAWFQANPQRVQGATLEQVRTPIRSFLTDARIKAARDAYLDQLKTKTTVKVLLDAPREVVSAGNSPVRGPASAPVELIEFADFECPYCQSASPTVTRVLETYGDRIRFVYRNYPLASHPNAVPAAEAAQCANEQGKFWAYHDRLFSNPGHLSVAELKQTAADLGLDPSRFNACVDSHKYQAVIEADTQAGNQAGVSGTPAFFINGRLLSGAQPFDAFKRLIDEELQLKANN